MYLTALVVKWRNKGIQFIIDYPVVDKVQLTACIIGHNKYITIITDDLEYACRVIDAELTAKMEVLVDNDNVNS